MRLTTRPPEIVPAWREHEDLWCLGLDVADGYRPRVLPGLRERIDSSRTVHHLGDPVSGGVYRIGPLDHRHTRTRGAGGAKALVHRPEARAEAEEELFGLVRRI